LERALEVLAMERAPRGASAAALRTVGTHPDGGDVTVHEGRYGPYVKYGSVNATLPKDTTPEAITLEEALELIAARAARGPAKKTTKKTVSKKDADAKPAAKKAAPKKAAPKKAGADEGDAPKKAPARKPAAKKAAKAEA
jgi:DNA topoisomerase-1